MIDLIVTVLTHASFGALGYILGVAINRPKRTPSEEAFKRLRSRYNAHLAALLCIRDIVGETDLREDER